MPTLTRLLLVLTLAIGGFYGILYLLVTFVDPAPRPMGHPIDRDRFDQLQQ